MSPEECKLKISQLTSCTRHATVYVTRSMHIKNQAHCLKQYRPQSVSPEGCTLKTWPTHHLKKNSQSVCFRSVQNKMQKGIPAEIGESTSGSPERCTRKGKPENELQDHLIVYRGTTHNLRNGRFRRELSQNILLSEI